jgi:ABC-type nitrate/sulfonate/bicarbonate transport system substrate-binding protein
MKAESRIGHAALFGFFLCLCFLAQALQGCRSFHDNHDQRDQRSQRNPRGETGQTGNPGPQRESEAQEVRFAVLSPGAATAVLEFGRDSGVFLKHGIALKIRYFYGGGNEGNAAIASGQLDAGAYGPPILTAIVRGLPIKIVAATAPPKARGSILAARPEIKSVADLKGKVLATSNRSMSPYQHAITILKAHGLGERDFKLLVANGSNSVQLLRTGQAQGAILSELDLAFARTHGFAHGLDTSGKYLGDYQASFIFASERFLKDKPDLAVGLLRAFFESREYARARPEAFFAYAYAKYGEKYAAELYRESLAKAQEDWSMDGAIDVSAVRLYLGYMVGWGDFRQSEVDSIPDGRLFDLSFLASSRSRI